MKTTVMAFSQGLVSGTDIPIEHLDYDYIGKCTKSSEVEKLLKILRYNLDLDVWQGV